MTAMKRNDLSLKPSSVTRVFVEAFQSFLAGLASLRASDGSEPNLPFSRNR
jgi:hypothetical protein